MVSVRENDPKFLYHIFDATPLATVIVNRAGKISLANAAAQQTLRLTKRELSQRTYDDPQWTITDFEGRPFPTEKLPFTVVQRTLLPAKKIQHAITHSDGKRIYLSIDAEPLLDDQGQFDGIIAFFKDISKRILAEKAQREQQATLESIFRAVPVGIGMVKNRHLTWANEKLQEICGYSEAELLNQSAKMLYPTDDDYEYVGEEKYRQIAMYGTGTVETHWQRKDGAIIDVLLSSTPLDLKDLDKGVTFSALDISPQKNLEKHLRQAEKMQAIGQLAGGIAHDFNNQLAGIMGFADLLEEALASNPSLKRYTSEILHATTRASELTFQLLAFAQQGKYLSVSVDIHKVVSEVVGLLSHSIHKNIAIEQHLLANQTTIKGDPSQIQNALLNLAIHGRDAMPQGGTLSFSTESVTIEKSRKLSSSQEIPAGKYVRLSVSDTGNGIPEADRLRIFEPFFSKDNESIGLGLAAVYGTCQNHNGAVDLVSVVGEGSTFSMYLPLETERRTHTDRTRRRDSATDLNRQIVLIVDDEEVVREMLKSTIESLHYRAITCADGNEAIATYRREAKNIAMVILDMVMPVKDGRTTFLELREIDPEAKILISSGYTIDDDAQFLLDSGALGFIQKPFRLAVISDKLNRLLANNDGGE